MHRFELGGPFDLIGGLPVHPLVVHVAVVALPVAALALIVVMALPRVPTLVRWGVIAALAVGSVSAWIAAESGEALSARVGEAEVHEELAENLPLVAGITFALGILWAVISQWASRNTASRALRGARIAVAVIAAAMAAYTIYFTIVVGHSGAVATWLPRVGG